MRRLGRRGEGERHAVVRAHLAAALGADAAVLELDGDTVLHLGRRPYVQQVLAGRDVRVSRLARGLPVGGDLEYLDGATLSHAFDARREVG